MAAGPTARTLERLRKEKKLAQVVEQWVPRANVRRDLFGFADIVALEPLLGFTAIQCTSGSNHAARKAKIIMEPRALVWLKAGGAILICSWSKTGPRGCRKVWTERIERISESDFSDAVDLERRERFPWWNDLVRKAG